MTPICTIVAYLLLCLSSIHALSDKILICGVGKNVARGFENVKRCAEKLGSFFDDYHVLIYENNSTDSTVQLYENWALANPKVSFTHETLCDEALSREVLMKGDYRTQLIARARNILLEQARQPQFADYAWILMADLDEFDPWDIPSIIKTIHHPERPFDAVFSNGNYDTYPFRHPTSELGPEFLTHRFWQLNVSNWIKYHLSQLLKNGRWLRVESAFGGIALYRKEAILSSSYQGRLDEAIVERELKRSFQNDQILRLHQGLRSKMEYHRAEFRIAIAEHLFDDPTLKLLHERFPHLPLYRCEHISLHQGMIANGYDRLYINPTWKSTNLLNRNY